MIDTFPFIKSMCLEMAYDNGVVNSEEPVEKFLETCDECLGADGVYFSDLKALESWLATLSEEQRSTIVTGEETDAEEICETCPLDLNGYRLTGLFTDIFENM